MFWTFSLLLCCFLHSKENLMKNTKKNLKTLIDIAMNRMEADLVIKNVDIVDVFNNAIVKGDIAIADGYIAGIGCYEGKTTFDGKGMYACPGFIDSHVHIESSMLTPLQFAKSVVPKGTTSIIADPHEIANVQGLDGIEYILSEGKKISFLDIYVMLPSCVPATPFEDSGAVLKASDLEKLKGRCGVLGLGEMMNFSGTINADKDILDKLTLFKYENIDGHAPLLKDKSLNAYIAAGIRTDHECTNVEEMKEKISLGMYILIREGSAAKDCSILVKGVTKDNNRSVMFCTDDKHPRDILNNGHIDNNVNIAIRGGIDPIDAIKIASLNACECYGLRNKGAIAPGYIADILLFDNLNNIKADYVFKSGRLVAEKGEMADFLKHQTEYKAAAINTVNFKAFSPDRFKISLTGNKVRVIELLENTLLTNMLELNVLKDKNNNFIASDDLLKAAVVERHNALDKIGLGIIKGYGLKNGAIATSVSHDSHNIIIVGDNDEDMYLAVNRIQEINGGIVLVKRGKVIGQLPLPIGGLMSDLSLKEISSYLMELTKLAYRELKINISLDPFITLSFLALPVIPNIKITDQGLFDVISGSFVDLEIKVI